MPLAPPKGVLLSLVVGRPSKCKGAGGTWDQFQTIIVVQRFAPEQKASELFDRSAFLEIRLP